MHIREALDRVLKMMRQKAWDDAIVALHYLLNVQVDDPLLLFLMGTCERMSGHDGLAYALFNRVLEAKEDHYEAAYNLCAILREMGRHDEEVALLKKCQKLRPEEADTLHNLAGAYLHNHTPEIAEDYARRSLELEGDRPDTYVQLGLSLLEQERFGEGFDAWDQAMKMGERKTRNFWALGQTPIWDGTPGLNVMVYGEQGHGDEIMFASCLKETIERSNQVFIDTSKWDLVDMYQRSFPETIVFCTPDSQLQNYHTELKIDATIPFGSLPTLFRRELENFPQHEGYIKSHPAKRREMRRRLDDLGDGLKIGIAWRGGIKKTHSIQRTIPLDKWAPILKQDNAHFVSLQYTVDAAGEAMQQEEVTGVQIHHWEAAIQNFDMLTALIDELDLVISVPQTAVHQRGALGKECWVMTAYKAPWTFGLEREDNVWYPKQVRQFRQEKNEDGWTPTVLRCAAELSKRTGSKMGPVITTKPVAFEDMQLRGPE